MSGPADIGAAGRTTFSEATIEFGRKLVAELGLEDKVDTLGRWMAHYIAELIADVEVASSTDRPAKADRCAAAILELWRHRHDMQDSADHFESESLLHAIASLDPDAERYRYYGRIRKRVEGEDETSRWLSLADGIDATARMLVLHCLVAAAAEAEDKSREWIAMAEAAGIEDDVPSIVLRFVTEQSDVTNELEPDDANREKLRNRLERLRTFLKLAKIMQNDLTARLGLTPDSKRKSSKRGKTARRDKHKQPRN